MTRHPSLLLLLLCLTGLTSLSLSRADTAPAAKPVRILNAHLGELPGLINADKTGPFVDLVRAIADLYPEVSIRITIYPLARAMAGVIAGTADFSLPAICRMPTCCPIASAPAASARSPTCSTAIPTTSSLPTWPTA